MKPTGKGVKNWDERYASDEFVFGTEPNDFLKSVAETIPAQSRVLCLADGEGRNGVYLASLGHQVTAVDQSATGLNKAQELAKTRGVDINTVVADLAEYALGVNNWDCIVSIFFHVPMALRDRIYPRIIDALAPEGILILESYTPEQLNFGTGGPPVAELMLTPDELKRHFNELEILHLRQLEREVIEGSGHTGRASVVQLKAKKSPG